MKKVLLLLFCLTSLSLFSSAQTTQVWIGGNAGDWDDTNNWQSGNLPADGDIAQFNNDVTVTSAAAVGTTPAQIHITAGSTVTLDLDLTIGNGSYAFEAFLPADGSTVNFGTIGGNRNFTINVPTNKQSFALSGPTGMANIAESSTLNIQQANQGFRNGIFTNNGTVNILPTVFRRGLFLTGGDQIFTNNGILNMQSPNNSGIDLRDGAQFVNNEDGVVSISNFRLHGIFLRTNSSASNLGTITISGGNIVEGNGIDINGSTFNNLINGTDRGVINIDDVDLQGIILGVGAFTNDGDINITDTQTNLDNGIQSFGTFTNTSTGIITVDKMSFHSISVQDGLTTNDGIINVTGGDGGTPNRAGLAVKETGSFINNCDGIINASGGSNTNSGRSLFVDNNNTFNNFGLINATGGRAHQRLVNEGTFINELGGVLDMTDGRAFANGGDAIFTNNGLIKTTFAAGVQANGAATATNNGFFDYGDPISTFTAGTATNVIDNGINLNAGPIDAAGSATIDLAEQPYEWFEGATSLGTAAADGSLTITDNSATDITITAMVCQMTVNLSIINLPPPPCVDNDPPMFADCPGDITVECDAIPAAADLMATDDCGFPGGGQDLVIINEFHYDNTGGDQGEFIEVAGTAGADLAGYSLELYNGSNGTVYNTINLSGLIPNEAGGLGAVDFQLATNGLQNGAPDGFALIDPMGNVLEFLSYEGVVTATAGTANGMMSTDIGVSETSGTPVGESLQLTGTGSVSGDFNWTGPIANSPGLLNAGQTIIIGTTPGPVTVSAVDVFTAGSCANERTITRTWSVMDASGKTGTCTQIITVEDNTAPTFNVALPANVTVSCDAIPSPATLTAEDNCGNGFLPFINEFHYDNTGGDLGEFIEVAGYAGTDLAGYSLALYNGSNGTVYNTVMLSGVISDDGDGYGAIDFQLAMNGLQNGSPDGFALVAPGGTVIEFLSYEGIINASAGPASGMMSTDVGLNEPSNSPVGSSIQRTGAGATGSDFSWTGPLAESLSAINAGQTFTGNVEVVFTETTAPGSCSEESTITRTWTATDDCGNPTSHTQIITVEDITAPEAACQNITVQLNENGEVEITPGEINNPTGGSTSSVMVGNTINQLDDVLKSQAGFCPTAAVSTNTCDCPTGFVAVGYSGLVGNSYGNVVSQFSLHCKEVMPNGDLGTAVTVTCSNGTLTAGTNSGPLLATGNDVLVGAQINIGCAIDGITGYSKPVSEILAVDPNTNSSAITTLGGMGGSPNPAMYVPAGSVIVGMETFEDPSPPNGTSLIGVSGGVAWRYATLSEVFGSTQDNCAAQNSLTYTLSQSLFTCDDLGENVVTLSVTDPCGNTGTCTAIVTVEDNIAPVITCPDNIYVHLDPGACDAIVTWNPATAIDNCEVVEINQTGGPVSGTTFDRNTTTTVSYEAIDQSGNVSTCSFTIEIIEFVPASNDITCNNLVHITLDENCEATVGADQILEGNNYGCYDDYIVTFVATGLPVILDGSHIGNTYEVMVVGPAGIPCWGSILVEDKTAPIITCYDIDVECDEALPTEPAPESTTAGSVATITDGGNGGAVGGMTYFDITNNTANDLIITAFDMNITANTLVDVYTKSGTSVGNTANAGLWTLAGQMDATTGAVSGPFPGNGTLTPAIGSITIAPGVNGIALQALSAAHNYTNGNGANQSFGDAFIQLELGSASNGPFAAPFTPRVFNGAVHYLQPLPQVAAYDACSAVTVTFTDSVEELGCNASGFSEIITRTWTATDASGNSSSCTSTYRRIIQTLDDVIADLPTDIVLECGDAIPDPLTSFGCDNIGIGLESESTIDICEGSYKILRNYILVDWCTNETVEHLQIIKVLDTQAPTVNAISDLTISTNSNNCFGAVQLPTATATDACSSVTVSATSSSAGTLNGNLLTDLPVGIHTVTYTATDGCGNEAEGTLTITVEDQIAPIAICDEHTILGIGSDGTASINATTFDDGSYDNCGIVEMTARRMDNPACAGFDATPFAATVPFYCCDVNTTVMVEFRVRDAAGNVNSCMVEVEVQDKINPTVICPADADVECSETYLDYIVVGQPLPQDAVDANGEAIASDNCPGVTLTNNVIGNTVDCGNGTITIVWTATDAVGRTSSCIQRYFVSNNDPFAGNDITWPLDLELTTCGLGLEPSDLGSYPTINEGACDNIAIGHQDQVLNFGVGDACLKILRKWYVIDWCQAGGNQDPTQPGPGVWHYTQIIKVINSNDPIVTVVDFPSVVENYDADCGNVFAAFEISADDDCTDAADIQVSWEFSTGLSGSGLSASGAFANGSYSLTFTVSDGCSNTVWETHDFTVVDAKKPTPVCIFAIATTVMPSAGAVTIWASDFESGSSYDNCTEYDNLEFSFSQDVNDDYITIECADIPADGLYPITLYVTDEAGNFDFCSTFISVQDPNGICVIPTGLITGTIETEYQEEVENVTVTLTNNNGLNMPVVTGSNGSFVFNMAPNDMDVTPEKDMNYLNGVTTYDLVLISKHILGTELLDSPYKVIAADANHSESVTTLDIVKLRALILHIDDELSNNNSWRFVDMSYAFPNAINPWQETFPEVIEVELNSIDPADFIGVKIGDVNGTASPNSLLGSDTRTFDGNLTLALEATEVAAGETFTVDFRANEFKNIEGYQFTLGFDNSAVEFVDVTSNLADLDAANFGLTKLSEGVITTSWNSNKGVTVANDEVLFSITFRANAAVNTAELLSINSRYTESEAYDGSDLYNVVLEFNGNEVSNGFELFQNTPNPFKAETLIGFNVPQAGEVILKIYDVSGRVLRLIEMDAVKGYNSVNVTRDGIDATGVLYYQLETATETVTKKMIIVD